MSDLGSEANAKAIELAAELGRLWWLVDAPLFIDETLVSRLYDAIVWPELENEEVQRSDSSKDETVKSAKGAFEAEVSAELPGILSWLLKPNLRAKANIDVAGEDKTEKTEMEIVEGKRIESAERRIIGLVAEYLRFYPDRVLFVDAPGGDFSNYQGKLKTCDVEKMLDGPPRPLVFLNIKPKSAILPTMAELEDCGFAPMFQELDEKFLAKLNPVPRYPSDSEQNSKDLRAKYWEEMQKNFRSRVAMEVIENAASKSRIGWIDFRLLFRDDGDTSHLHVVPAGKYHAGVFAYNFVHRGWKYGCRVVGSLRAGNDINVLAIYER